MSMLLNRDILNRKTQTESEKSMTCLKKNNRSHEALFSPSHLNPEEDLETIQIQKSPSGERIPSDSTQNVLVMLVPKLSEASVRDDGLFRISANGLAILDSNGRLLQVNDPFCSILGYPEQDLLSRPLSEFGHAEDDGIQIDMRIQEVLSAENNQYLCINRYLHQSGRTVWCEEQVSTLYDAGQKPSVYLLQWQERTALMGLEAQIQASGAERAALLKEVHHRVRNNLQIISSLLSLQARYANLCTSQELNAKCQSRIQAIALVHEIMYHADNFTDVNLYEFILEVFRNLKNANYRKARDVDLKVNLDNVAFSIDIAIPLGLVLNELLSNAITHAFPFMRPGDCLIEVHLSDQGNGTLELCVCDNGVGFIRDAEPENKESLGLYLVTMLVQEQLDGEIQFSQGKGSRVIIHFPD